jgi:hypothetical protein
LRWLLIAAFLLWTPAPSPPPTADEPFPLFWSLPIEASATWDQVRDHFETPLGLPADPAALNRAVNAAITYQEEPPGEDDWQTPQETWTRKTGDCEDYAILKYAVLLASGVAEADLLLVVGRIAAASPQVHAILLLRGPGGWVVLDNRFDHLIPPGEYINFTPVKGFSGGRAWLFARPFSLAAR